MNLDYVFAYYTVAVLSVLLAPFIRWEPKTRSRSSGILLRFWIILILSITYLVGMIRQYGIDYEAYLYAFYKDSSIIPDIGFRVLMFLFHSAGFRFEVMMLSIGFFTLYSLKRVARKFDISFTLYLILYFLHLALIRDFSQLRIGLAMSIIYLAITFTGKLSRFTAYFIAVSVHATSLLFIIFYEYGMWLCRLKNPSHQKISALLSWILVFSIGSFIQVLAFLDERVDIYLNWNEEGYGAPVTQFTSLFLHLAILAIAYLTRKLWLNSFQITLLSYLQITGVVVFFSLANYAIFAFRLSNVVFSLYPVLLICLLKKKIDKRSYFNAYFRRFVYVVVSFFLISRSGSVDILRAMEFDFLSFVN